VARHQACCRRIVGRRQATAARPRRCKKVVDGVATPRFSPSDLLGGTAPDRMPIADPAAASSNRSYPDEVASRPVAGA
jgi:hypothetical protein